MDERVFYALLERVGGNGRYQIISLFVWSFLALIIGSTSFFLPYVFYQGSYQCLDQYNNCKEYVCSLPPSERTQYVHDDLFSLASKFGDYRCDSNVELDRLQSFIYFGGVVGILVGAFTNEIIAKRMLLIVTVIASIVGLVTALFGPTLLIASIGLFINSAATAIQMEMIQCCIAETVSEDIRGQHLNITYIFFSLGVIMNGLFFYLLKNWQAYIIILILILLGILLFLKFYIEETPFDVLTYSTPEDSLRVLKKIGLANSRQNDHKITLPELENVKRQFQENEQKKQHNNISVLDLFRFDSLRTLTIVSLVLHYVTFFQFSAPEIAISDYSLSIYMNGIIIGFGQLIGSIASYLIIDQCERKKAIFLAQGICITTSVSVFLFFSCPNGMCSIQTQIVQTIGLTIFKFATTVSYNFFCMIQYEAFPNQIRGLAIQVVCMPAFLATVTLPQIITFCESSGISIVFSFILCSAMLVVLMIWLPQTFGIPPPEIIEELKYEHHALEDPNAQEKMKET